MFEGESMRTPPGASSSYCVVGPRAFHRPVRRALAIRSNRSLKRVERPATSGQDESPRGAAGEDLAHRRRECENRTIASHEKGLQRDLKGGNGPQRMLFECRQEMSEGEFRRMFRGNLRRFA